MDTQDVNLNCGRKMIYVHDSLYASSTKSCSKNVVEILNTKCYLDFECQFQVTNHTFNACSNSVSNQLDLEYECLGKFSYFQIRTTQLKIPI